MEQPIAATAETLTPPPMSLKEHTERETAAEPVIEKAPVVEAKAEPPAVTPEQEAESAKPDADLSEAGRTLRLSRRDARIKKLADENQQLNEQLRIRKQLRDELDRLAPGQQATAAPQTAGTTTDLEPQEDDIGTKYADYGAFVTAKARWAAREEHRQLAAMDARTRHAQTADRELASKEAKAREKYSDFDAVVVPLVDQFGTDPRGKTIADFVRASAIGEDVVYALAKDPTAIRDISGAETETQVLRALIRLEDRLTEAAKPAPKPMTSAPVPPSMTVGSGSTASTMDTRKGVPLKDHIRIEEAELAERRKAGHRY